MKKDLVDTSAEERLQDLGIQRISLPTPFPVGPVNTFLIQGDPPILFDAGLNTEESYEGLVAGLKAIGLKPADLGVIVVTHGHRDHMGLLGRLLAETDAVAYGHPEVQELGLHGDEDPVGRKEFYLGILDEFGVPTDIKEQANSLYDRFRSFSDPYRLDHVVEDGGLALDFRAHFVPGHSLSDTLFVNEASGYSVTGDHILTASNPNPLLRRPKTDQPRAKSLVEYQASLRKTRELDLGICLPGHGETFSDHVAVVDRILERQEIRSGQVREFVGRGAHTPYAVSRRLFPDLPWKHLHLGLSVAVGHLEVLEERGVLESGHEGGILMFRFAG